ncbi:hypothetical protein D3C77_709480 [compost metagenome]
MTTGSINPFPVRDFDDTELIRRVIHAICLGSDNNLCPLLGELIDRRSNLFLLQILGIQIRMISL